jgi:hypothetical protein
VSYFRTGPRITGNVNFVKDNCAKRDAGMMIPEERFIVRVLLTRPRRQDSALECSVGGDNPDDSVVKLVLAFVVDFVLE